MFGDVADGKMALNTCGKIVDFFWKKIPIHIKNVDSDEFQIMPNHFHGIIHIVGAMHSGQKGANNHKISSMNASPLQEPTSIRTEPHGTQPGSLGAILQNFQSITSRKINKIRKTLGSRLWQRNYYEHIIRDESELNRIRQYIIENPLKWQEDKYYAGRHTNP